MARRKIVLGLLCGGAFLGAWLFSAYGQPSKMNESKLRVGTFDSRAIAVAYAHSGWNAERLKAKKAEMEKAKAAGDTKKIAEIEKWGNTQQDKLHRQGFGTVSVRDLLDCIKDQIPRIALQTGVDIIVSKWDITYQAQSVETIDITKEMVQPFKPDPKTLSIINDLVNKAPISEEGLEKVSSKE